MHLFIKKNSLLLLLALLIQVVLQAQPANDLCANATLLTAGTSCANTAGTLISATSTAGLAACGNTASPDVWYKFVATSQFPTITVSSVGASLNTAGVRVQVFSGSCGSFTQIVCSTSLITTFTFTPLIVGNTYYVRVTTNTLTTVQSSGTYTFNICITYPAPVVSSRMGEVFQQTILVSGPTTNPVSNRLFDPWEVTYGPDDSLWVTEAKGYKVKKISPVDGGQRTILDLTKAGTFTPAGFKCKFTPAQNPWPQGGLMGLAIHPDFNKPVNPKKYIYLAYVDSFVTNATGLPNVTTNYAGELVKGWVFVTYLVRFTYDNANLISPVMICDTLRGSNDHNSGRMIIKPIGGVPYLIYALGDMGAGQFDNINRLEKAQMLNSYEGKILRFNLEPDGDAGVYDQWIPNDNPFNTALGVQSAVWSLGIRNNQGFAYDSVLDKIYGSSHGPFSDDELNVIEGNRNYGHPLVIGDSSDGNYNNAKPGPIGSSFAVITTERANALAINATGAATGTTYKNTLYSFYPAAAGDISTAWTIQYIYNNIAGSQNANISWKSEATSGIGLYNSSLIPGWKNSLLISCLKGGRIMRTKLDATGDVIVPTAGGDTVTYFRSVNRFRDVAISPDGKNIFAVIDSSATTSGPTTTNPMVSACRGCLQRYTFLGYNDNAGLSTISNTIPIAPGVNNTLTNGTIITIDGTNNNLWVPITDSLGNIIAEINANGNNLGTVTSSLYIRSGSVRVTHGGTPYMDRSMTITVQNQPSTPVNVRLYFTAAELANLIAAPSSTVAGIGSIVVYKNTDPVSASLTALPISIIPTAVNKSFGSDYVVTASISSFSSFYFSGSSFVLPVDVLALNGKYANDAVALDWKTANENNSANFVIEKSTTGQTFKSIGTVAASGFTTTTTNYAFTDNDLANDYAPVLYYRLKMFDQNGSYKYSNTISVNLPSLTGAVTITPNPVPDEMKVYIVAPVNTKAEWRVIDNAGTTMLYGNTMAKKGTSQLSVNVSKLPAGAYYLHVTGTNIECKTKFQKL